MIEIKEIQIFFEAVIRKLETDNQFNFADGFEMADDGSIPHYIWIGTKGGIGTWGCHYEIIFYSKKGGYESTPSVEVHFENTNYKQFQNLNFSDCLTYDKWKRTEKRRIIFKENNCDITQLSEKKALEYVFIQLRVLHKEVGSQLEKIVNNISDSNRNKSLSLIQEYGKKMKCASLSEIRHIPERYFSSKTIEIEHTLIQNKILNFLLAKRNAVSITCAYVEAIIDKKRADLMDFANKKIYLYEIKTYADPVKCIREAIGQLLEYKWLLKIKGITVNNLIIVGKKENTPKGKEFLKEINALLNNDTSTKVSYKWEGEF